METELSLDAGVTLLELLLGLTIMVLVLVTATPQVRRMIDHFEVERAAGAIMASLEDGRVVALRSNASVSLQVTSVGNVLLDVQGPLQFLFRPDGTGEGGLVLLRSGGDRRVIDLDPLSGRPRMRTSLAPQAAAPQIAAPKIAAP